jgi:hypothetical protein
MKSRSPDSSRVHFIVCINRLEYFHITGDQNQGLHMTSKWSTTELYPRPSHVLLDKISQFLVYNSKKDLHGEGQDNRIKAYHSILDFYTTVPQMT